MSMPLKVKTLEELLKSWNPGLYVFELKDNMEVDSVRYKGSHICSIPKGAKYKPWSSFMAPIFREDGEMTIGGVHHRTFKGLLQTLINKKIISWDANKMSNDALGGGYGVIAAKEAFSGDKLMKKK